jgi:hypothetical protein
MENPCVDFYGNEININDWVALSLKGSTDLIYGKVIKINEKSVAVKVNSYSNLEKRLVTTVRYRSGKNVIRIDAQVVFENILTK